MTQTVDLSPTLAKAQQSLHKLACAPLDGGKLDARAFIEAWAQAEALRLQQCELTRRAHQARIDELKAQQAAHLAQRDALLDEVDRLATALAQHIATWRGIHAIEPMAARMRAAEQHRAERSRIEAKLQLTRRLVREALRPIEGLQGEIDKLAAVAVA